jgi:hypothetical protein
MCKHFFLHNKQELEIQMLNLEAYPTIQLVLFVIQPHVGLKYLVP